MSQPIPEPSSPIARRTERPLPAQRHLPGEGMPAFTPVLDFAYGCDLFDLRYYWEAHEVWECEWRALPASHPERSLLQGLICAAAFAVKKHQGITSGAERLLERAESYLQRAEPRGRGIDITALIDRLRQFQEGGPWVLLPPA